MESSVFADTHSVSQSGYGLSSRAFTPSAKELEELYRENRLLKRKLHVVSGSWLYATALFFAYLCHSCKKHSKKYSKKILSPTFTSCLQVVSKSKMAAAIRLVKSSVLFDNGWYIAQAEAAGYSVPKEPLEHYLLVGWRQGLSPSPFFDPDFVGAQLGKIGRGKCPLVVFLLRWRELGLNPNLLFNTSYYRQNLESALSGALNISELNDSPDPVTYFLKLDKRETCTTSPLFDSVFYAERYGCQGRASEIWELFMREGRFQGRQPNPFFSPGFYINQLPLQERTALRPFSRDTLALFKHYLGSHPREDLRPHPEFDYLFYREQVKLIPQFASDGIKPMSNGHSTEYANPLFHYLAWGRQQQLHHSHSYRHSGLYPSHRLQERMSQSEESAKTEAEKIELEQYLGSGQWPDMELATWRKLGSLKTSGQKVVLLAGHEASLTGAPMVLLALLEKFVQDGCQCIVTLLRGGPLLDKYRSLATVEVLEDSLAPNEKLQVLLATLLAKVDKSRIAGVIVNTAETVKVQPLFKEMGLKTVCLVHEFADSYSSEHMKTLYDSSDVIVFSSQFLLEQAQNKRKFVDVPAVVLPQGIVDGGATSDLNFRDMARTAVRQEIGVSSDAFVIFSCGSLDLRKGLDWFSQIVPRVLKEGMGIEKEESSGEIVKAGKPIREIHFVWIGDGNKELFSPYYYAVKDLEQQGLSGRVHFLPPRQALEHWFYGCDVFLLSSRQDPLPCVAQSAMVAAMPVVAFDGTGGIPEYVRQGAGVVVPYGDIEAASRAILCYYQNEGSRQAAGKIGAEVAREQFQFSSYYESVRGLL